jgi:hypothetical protein
MVGVTAAFRRANCVRISKHLPTIAVARLDLRRTYVALLIVRARPLGALTPLTEMTADFEPIALRQHDIEQDEIVTAFSPSFKV